MRLGGDCRLRHGIYAVRLQRADGTIHGGVASYGRRPTFDNGAPLLETFVFDFSGDLYGETVSVAFIDWIRPELKFASVEDLVAAMDRDSATARAALASAGPGSSLDIALATLG
jgi:riboflavin kinase/FMN adenylyltransferase